MATHEDACAPREAAIPALQLATADGSERTGRAAPDFQGALATASTRATRQAAGSAGSLTERGPSSSAGPHSHAHDDGSPQTTREMRSGDAPMPMSNYAFFVKYTYSNECALLAYNFHELVTKLGIFEQFAYRHDHRLISVTLAYIFYRYQVHHCDMALDLAVTLVYLEDVRHSPDQPELQEIGRASCRERV